MKSHNDICINPCSKTLSDMLKQLVSMARNEEELCLSQDMRDYFITYLETILVDSKRLQQHTFLLENIVDDKYPFIDFLDSQTISIAVSQGINKLKDQEIINLVIDPLVTLTLFENIQWSEDPADVWFDRFQVVWEKEGQDEKETVPQMITDHLLAKGEIVLPAGVVQECYEFGRLPFLEQPYREEIIEDIAGKAYRDLSWRLPVYQKNILIFFGEGIDQIATRIAEKFTKSDRIIKLVYAWNYADPHLGCDPNDLRNANVTLLSDVTHTGSGLLNLCRLARARKPRTLDALTIIDQTNEQTKKNLEKMGLDRLHGLWKSKREVTRPIDDYQYIMKSHCPEQILYFDSNLGLSVPFSDKDHKINTTNTFNGLGDELSLLKKSLKLNRKIYHNFYQHAIDVLSLLKDEEISKSILDKAVNQLQKIIGNRSYCVVFQATKRQRAGVWANILAKALNCRAISIGTCTRNFVFLKEEQKEELSDYDLIIIADVVIRTGNTLQEVIRQLQPIIDKNAEATVVTSYVVNGLPENKENSLKKRLSMDINSVIRFPLSPPLPLKENQMRSYINQWLHERVQEFELRSKTDGSPWVQELYSFFKKELQNRMRKRGNVKERCLEEADIKRVIDEEQSSPYELIVSQQHPQRIVNRIRKLSSQHLLLAPRMRELLKQLLLDPERSLSVRKECFFALCATNWIDFSWLQDWITNNFSGFQSSTRNHKEFFWSCLWYSANQIKQQGDNEKIKEAQNCIDATLSKFKSEENSKKKNQHTVPRKELAEAGVKEVREILSGDRNRFSDFHANTE